jgi:methylated-DNA-[protein]-cysteine S-methyltransferase
MWTTTIKTPLGDVIAAANDRALTGLWFCGQKHFPVDTAAWLTDAKQPVFTALREWLAAYFGGTKPATTMRLEPAGTAFQQSVWAVLRKVSYGKTTTYGALAAKLGGTGARAVGSAVGRNPVSIIVPCHRVLGANGSLTGYAGGLDRKTALLTLEGVLNG